MSFRGTLLLRRYVVFECEVREFKPLSRFNNVTQIRRTSHISRKSLENQRSNAKLNYDEHQRSNTGTDVWLAAWTSASNGTTPEINSDLPVVNDRDDTRFYLGIYMAFALISAVLAFSRVHIFASGCVVAARNLFYDFVSNIVFAPMAFFETTPLGRITNRISYDTEVIDSLLLQRVNGVIAST